MVGNGQALSAELEGALLRACLAADSAWRVRLCVDLAL